ncbi:MAG: di-trans,poly-cis-decaprenylcistransferase, partial [Lachnospiraceae bacterium]|nr:di-trans,poly-cis-decaprenylcistransferase [Lachnospiraceae bacterium]
NYLVDSIERASKNNMRVRIIGDRTALDKDIVEKIEELEEKTKGYDGLTFTIALNYGGRDELRRSIQAIAADVKADKLSLSEIDEKLIGSYLDTDGIPDPDLMIRTSGEVRLSNYLIWQLAYSEFCFMDVLWPDFTIEHLKDAIRYYNKKERRFGGVK